MTETMIRKRPQLSLDQYIEGILKQDITILSRSISLMESTLPTHHQLSLALLDRLMPYTGKAHRIAISGVPGVGKSTFIEAFGMHLIDQGLKVAVLAIDPSSVKSGGSILGDKTRMPILSIQNSAFIRPSPSAGTLGGVALKTREAALLCEAFGFDVILIETVGVGQSEVIVSEMTDSFIALMLGNAGDELQGMKRGLMEVVDLLVVNKADGELKLMAQRAVQMYQGILQFFKSPKSVWTPKAIACSALQKEGMVEIWDLLCQHRQMMTASGEWESKREKQSEKWFISALETALHDRLISEMSQEIELAQEALKKGRNASMLAKSIFEKWLSQQKLAQENR
jgi:LAO/AO transport system kinase